MLKTGEDREVGIKGELFVYEYILEQVMSGRPGNVSWTSELRHLAKPELGKWSPPDKTTFFADITIDDKDGHFRKWLEIQGYVDGNQLPGMSLKFHIEVKSSKGGNDDAFHLSDWQLEAARDMAEFPEDGLDDGRVVANVFLIWRVTSALGKTPGWSIIDDFWKKWLEGNIIVRAPQGLLVWETRELK